MTRGFLIFAQNNSDVDYCKIATFCARRLKKYIDLPITLITDSKEWLLASQPDAVDLFDQIIPAYTDTTQQRRYSDGSLYSKQLVWKNLSRVEAYETHHVMRMVECEGARLKMRDRNKFIVMNFE
jgi:hypothetical protein